MIKINNNKDKWIKTKETLSGKQYVNRWLVLTIVDKERKLGHCCLVKYNNDIEFYDKGKFTKRLEYVNGESNDMAENLTDNYYWSVFEYRTVQRKKLHIVNDEDLN